jgi:hypothetical protein
MRITLEVGDMMGEMAGMFSDRAFECILGVRGI